MKRVEFSETIAASDLKASRCRHIIEFMKVCEYCRSRLFLDLGQRLCTFKNSNRIFSEPAVAISTKSSYESFQLHGNENLIT